MDLILWRHAEAEERIEPDAPDAFRRDLARGLTGKGQKHAARMAAWLDRQLGESARILVSPALRCEQTALNLGRKFKTCEQLRPDHGAQDLLELVQWPQGRGPVLVVGHQPALGQAAAHLLGLSPAGVSIRKGTVWWLRHRMRDGQAQTLLMTVQAPEFL